MEDRTLPLRLTVVTNKKALDKFIDFFQIVKTAIKFARCIARIGFYTVNFWEISLTVQNIGV